tara:strand:- start:1405 stop:1539 length:135 start_codon:yes stop_codon:yes gene_type:complete
MRIEKYGKKGFLGKLKKVFIIRKGYLNIPFRFSLMKYDQNEEEY